MFVVTTKYDRETEELMMVYKHGSISWQNVHFESPTGNYMYGLPIVKLVHPIIPVQIWPMKTHNRDSMNVVDWYPKNGAIAGEDLLLCCAYIPARMCPS